MTLDLDELTPALRFRYQVLARYQGCFIRPIVERLVAERPNGQGLVRCDGVMDAHHLISQRRIRDSYPFGAGFREGRWIRLPRDYPAMHFAELPDDYDVALGDLLSDPRLGIAICRRHHELLESKAIKLSRSDLPEHVEEAARDIGMEWSLSRDYGERRDR